MHRVDWHNAHISFGFSCDQDLGSTDRQHCNPRSTLLVDFLVFPWPWLSKCSLDLTWKTLACVFSSFSSHYSCTFFTWATHGDSCPGFPKPNTCDGMVGWCGWMDVCLRVENGLSEMRGRDSSLYSEMPLLFCVGSSQHFLIVAWI